MSGACKLTVVIRYMARTEPLLQGTEAHSGPRQAGSIFISVHLSKTLKLPRAFCYFSAVCFIKTVAEAFQNLKITTDRLVVY